MDILGGLVTHGMQWQDLCDHCDLPAPDEAACIGCHRRFHEQCLRTLGLDTLVVGTPLSLAGGDLACGACLSNKAREKILLDTSNAASARIKHAETINLSFKGKDVRHGQETKATWYVSDQVPILAESVPVLRQQLGTPSHNRAFWEQVMGNEDVTRFFSSNPDPHQIISFSTLPIIPGPSCTNEAIVWCELMEKFYTELHALAVERGNLQVALTTAEHMKTVVNLVKPLYSDCRANHDLNFVWLFVLVYKHRVGTRQSVDPTEVRFAVQDIWNSIRLSKMTTQTPRLPQSQAHFGPQLKQSARTPQFYGVPAGGRALTDPFTDCHYCGWPIRLHTNGDGGEKFHGPSKLGCSKAAKRSVAGNLYRCMVQSCRDNELQHWREDCPVSNGVRGNGNGVRAVKPRLITHG